MSNCCSPKQETIVMNSTTYIVTVVKTVSVSQSQSKIIISISQISWWFLHQTRLGYWLRKITIPNQLWMLLNQFLNISRDGWHLYVSRPISSNKILLKYIVIIFIRITVCWAIVSFMANVVQLKQYKLLYGKNSLPTSPYWCVLIFVAVLSCSVSVIYLYF